MRNRALFQKSLGVLSVSIAFAYSSVAFSFCEDRWETTQIQMVQLALLLRDFKRVCGSFPTTAQGLDAMARRDRAPDCKRWKPFIQNGRIPQDAWGRDFLYLSDGNRFTIDGSFGIFITDDSPTTIKFADWADTHFWSHRGSCDTSMGEIVFRVISFLIGLAVLFFSFRQWSRFKVWERLLALPILVAVGFFFLLLSAFSLMKR